MKTINKMMLAFMIGGMSCAGMVRAAAGEENGWSEFRHQHSFKLTGRALTCFQPIRNENGNTSALIQFYIPEDAMSRGIEIEPRRMEVGPGKKITKWTALASGHVLVRTATTDSDKPSSEVELWTHNSRTLLSGDFVDSTFTMLGDDFYVHRVGSRYGYKYSGSTGGYQSQGDFRAEDHNTRLPFRVSENTLQVLDYVEKEVVKQFNIPCREDNIEYYSPFVFGRKIVSAVWPRDSEEEYLTYARWDKETRKFQCSQETRYKILQNTSGNIKFIEEPLVTPVPSPGLANLSPVSPVRRPSLPMNALVANSAQAPLASGVKFKSVEPATPHVIRQPGPLRSRLLKVAEPVDPNTAKRKTWSKWLANGTIATAAGLVVLNKFRQK